MTTRYVWYNKYIKDAANGGVFGAAVFFTAALKRIFEADCVIFLVLALVFLIGVYNVEATEWDKL